MKLSFPLPFSLLLPLLPLASSCAVPDLAIISIPYPLLLTARFTPSLPASPLTNTPLTILTPYTNLHLPLFSTTPGLGLPHALNFTSQTLALHEKNKYPVILPIGGDGTASPVVWLSKDDADKVGGEVVDAVGVYGCEDVGEEVERWTELKPIVREGDVEWCVLNGLLHVKKMNDKG
ncbi:hypothetical protein EX30DRAFT_348901 [Ascodesmis nigricans]|uniref:Uncharacterized protein n=1 Tax=Ascodesmis nigricans TaxID=341454 RepID=A0A4S2MWL4_9PEZI|nr:hypothetical protein EX30DRAFT_348901 [Ascodesmis nigricans]